MSILCAMFGHKPPAAALNAGADYMKIAARGTDGIGRQHVALYGECPRCEQKYKVGMAHLPRANHPASTDQSIESAK